MMRITFLTLDPEIQRKKENFCTLSGKIRLTNLCPIINNRGFNCPMSILKTEQKSDSKNLLFYIIKTTTK